MKRCLTIVAIVGAILTPGTCYGQVPTGSSPDLGPGDQGATLKQPALEPAGKAPPYQYPFQDPFSPSAPQHPFGIPAQPKPAGPKFNQTDINKDIEVTAETGPWLV